MKRKRIARRVVQLAAVYVRFRLNGAIYEDVVNMDRDRYARSGPVDNSPGLSVRTNRKRDTLEP